jgi:HPt (histidine-containing phosphotransfer) domain-containing protein
LRSSAEQGKAGTGCIFVTAAKREVRMEQKTSKNANQTAVCSSPIDLSELLRICEDEDIIYAVLQAFMEDALVIFQNLDQAIQARDCSQIAMYSHRMKGSSCNIGAVALSEISLRMELRAKEGNLESMDQDYVELKRLYELLRTFVSNENWLGELRKEAGEAQYDGVVHRERTNGRFIQTVHDGIYSG